MSIFGEEYFEQKSEPLKFSNTALKVKDLKDIKISGRNSTAYIPGTNPTALGITIGGIKVNQKHLLESGYAKRIEHISNLQLDSLLEKCAQVIYENNRYLKEIYENKNDLMTDLSLNDVVLERTDDVVKTYFYVNTNRVPFNEDCRVLVTKFILA